ncbi:cell surface glycoprotein CD200 receptor 1-like isoform X2 [Meles meles]|uniref:cell surface glycoprotein CD200 receptor 1-like isoform X2 n=1 Tax=Meles meles TaxID=9662 RepID=UPI001E69AAE6|nr:cell surface glycoprotein CD200 receptor 1-like isoform X2 [Meles meles]
MPCTRRTPKQRLLPILTVCLVLECIRAGVGSSGTPGNSTKQQTASTHSSSVKGKERSLTLPAEANTSLSVPVDTKAVLLCPPDNSTALLVTWTISLRDQPPCTRAYRRDNNETSERNCTDERISWESRPDQNPALQIDPVAITHDGYYRCEVAAPDGLFGHTYCLRVLVPPKVTLFRDSSGTVVCRAAAGKPSAQIFWTPRGDCHAEEEPLGNGTVTVQSTCHWEGRQVSNVSCSVSHVTGNKSLFLELKTGDQLSPNSTTFYITSFFWFALVLVALVIVGSIGLWKTHCCRKCKLKKTEATSVVEEKCSLMPATQRRTIHSMIP